MVVQWEDDNRFVASCQQMMALSGAGRFPKSIELRDFVAEDENAPKTLLFPRDPSLDPQLVWKGKGEQDRQLLAMPFISRSWRKRSFGLEQSGKSYRAYRTAVARYFWFLCRPKGTASHVVHRSWLIQRGWRLTLEQAVAPIWQVCYPLDTS